MAMIKLAARPEVAAARDLRNLLHGRVVERGDDAYEHIRRIWNGAVDHQPALFALCRSAVDVQAAVRTARAYQLPLSVRGGGHDWAGRALRHGGLVIDLAPMRAVEIDPETRIATVAGGATAADVAAAAAAHGLTAVTGTVGAVGMAGLTLGGGYGPLIARHGLALDNLVGAELVLADGRRIVADGHEHPELFWALRGGGGNFGVVTALRLRLHALPCLLAGLILFPWSEAEAVLQGYAALAATAPEALSVLSGVLSGPTGAPLLFLAPTWCGERAPGLAAIEALRRLGSPVAAQVDPTTGAELLGRFDAHIVSGRHYALETRWVPALTPPVIAALVQAGSAKSSPFSAIALHHFRGAATRIGPAATAFGQRREHLLVEIVAAWEPGGDGAAHRRWAGALSDALAPHALPGGYANLLAPGAADQIAHAFGGNALRLHGVKRRYDPDRIFSAALSLPEVVQ